MGAQSRASQDNPAAGGTPVTLLDVTSVEEIIEPDLPICDPHHHLWDRPGNRYLLDDLLADVGSGHKVESTVFVEAAAFYSADLPPNLAPVGETEAAVG